MSLSVNQAKPLVIKIGGAILDHDPDKASALKALLVDRIGS